MTTLHQNSDPSALSPADYNRLLDDAHRLAHRMRREAMDGVWRAAQRLAKRHQAAAQRRTAVQPSAPLT